MIKVLLLQNYKNNVAGDIITISDLEAESIVEDKIARYTNNRDFLVKPKTIFGNMMSRAFNKSPKIK